MSVGDKVLVVSLAASAALLVGMIGSTSNPTASAAPPGGPPSSSVTLVSPIPLPVSGSVSAAQSGAWNVGLVGTPSVSLAGTPTVNVQNAAAMPVFFRNVDDPGRIPYQSINFINCTGQDCNFAFPPVPAGHRLVVTHVSGDVQVTTVPNVIAFSVGRQDGATITGFMLPPPYELGVNAFDHAVLFYVDGGQFYSFTVLLDSSSTFLSGFGETFVATGYLLDCSAAPCAPIAQ
jgi:hypothetical protein